MEYQNHSELRLRSDEAFWSRCIIAFLEVPPSLLNLLDSTSWAVAACMMRRQGRNPEDTGEHDYLKRTEKKTSLSRILKLSQAFDFFFFLFLLLCSSIAVAFFWKQPFFNGCYKTFEDEFVLSRSYLFWFLRLCLIKDWGQRSTAVTCQ